MRPITLMGMIDGNRTSYMVKEDRYRKRDFVWLAAFLLEKYRDKIASAEGRAVGDDALEITFSFINANGEKRTISNSGDRMDQCYEKCEGRLYWDHALAAGATPSQCPRCSKLLSVTGKFCPFCGGKLALMCDNCNCELTAEMLFCPNCGRETAESLVRKAEKAVAEKNYEWAEQMFQKALSEDAENAKARSGLAEVKELQRFKKRATQKAEEERKQRAAEVEKRRKERLGIITDARTGLEWYEGPDSNADWNEAKRWVKNLTVDGGGWRLPSRSELKGLYREGEGKLNRDPVFKTTGSWVWSGETDGSSSAWRFGFLNGKESSIYRDNSFYGRAFAVRSR